MYRRDERVLETMVARLALAAALPLPTGVLQPALDIMVSVLRRRHPGAFERLSELPDAEVLIDPIDLPMAFMMRLGSKGMRLSLAHRGSQPGDAVIRGSFAHLLDLLEGRTDGDALFFSRDLTIEGDTAAVVALRNAVDGEDIDLAADLAAVLGPFARLLLPARRAAVHLSDRLGQLHQAMLQPANRRMETLERRLSRLEKSGARLEKAGRQEKGRG
jgi:predicted lipid carrier protein YhbT